MKNTNLTLQPKTPSRFPRLIRRHALLLLLVPVLFSRGAWAGPQSPLSQNITSAFGNLPAARFSPVTAPVIPAVPAPSVYRGPDSAAKGTRVPAGWDNYFKRLFSVAKSGGMRSAGANRLELLVDGQEAFSALNRDIARARQFIHIKMFIWSPDEYGTELSGILAAKAKEGVRVRITLDFCGAYLFNPVGKMKKLIASMRDAGIELKVGSFRPLHADHRKVLVMDDGEGGMTAYTGGMNIGVEYRHNWHDQLTRVTGPATSALHQSFLDDWEILAGQILSGFPAVQPERNGARTYVLTQRGGDKNQNIKKAYLLAIKTARLSIRITKYKPGLAERIAQHLPLLAPRLPN